MLQGENGDLEVILSSDSLFDGEGMVKGQPAIESCHSTKAFFHVVVPELH